MKALVGNKIVSEKEFAQAEQIYENARISTRQSQRTIRQAARLLFLPSAVM